MLEKGALTGAETDVHDWRIALFAQINAILQKEHGVPTVLAILAEDDRNNEEPPRFVPYLSEIIGVKDEDLPQIYLMGPDDSQVLPYPEKLESPESISPELVLAWARLAIVKS